MRERRKAKREVKRVVERGQGKNEIQRENVVQLGEMMERRDGMIEEKTGVSDNLIEGAIEIGRKWKNDLNGGNKLPTKSTYYFISLRISQFCFRNRQI